MENANYAKVIKTLGIAVGDIPKNSKYNELKTIDIPPNSLGLFAPAIDSMTLVVKGAFIDTTAKYVILLNYSYEHSNGGSNGYEVRLVSSDAGKTWLVQ